ncbi:MAG: acetyltransferase [Gammaproteobacteria bacterium]
MSAEPELMQVACAVQQACIAAARCGYADAAQSGVCSEGALEAAIGAIQTLDLAALVRTAYKRSAKP